MPNEQRLIPTNDTKLPNLRGATLSRSTEQENHNYEAFKMQLSDYWTPIAK